MTRGVAALLPLCLAAIGFAAPAPQEQKQTDTFFTGNVVESSADHLKVSRVLQGKAEERQFRMTPETKIEGTVRKGERVAVRYVSSDDGDTATLVIVRPPPSKKK